LELGKVSGGKAISGVSSIDYLCVEQNVTEIEPWYQGIVKNQGLRELVSRMYIFHLAPGQDAFWARDAFRTCSDVELADAYDIPVLFYTPNDPQRTSQWHLTKIHAYDAWDIFRGDTTRTAIIGIVDTGIYYTHPDLASNMWINDQEDLNHNGIKDAGDINGEDDDAVEVLAVAFDLERLPDTKEGLDTIEQEKLWKLLLTRQELFQPRYLFCVLRILNRNRLLLLPPALLRLLQVEPEEVETILRGQRLDDLVWTEICNSCQ